MPLGGGHPLFEAHLDLLGRTRKPAQGAIFQHLMQFSHIECAKGHKHRVARVIMGFVKGFEGPKGQARNVSWIPARVVMIGCGRKQLLIERFPKHRS